jgi:hypothetical protein
MEKIKTIASTFEEGVKAQLKQQWTWGTAISIGLYQGLKYKGNLRTGLAGGFATLVVFAGASGVYNLVTNWDKVEKVLTGD